MSTTVTRTTDAKARVILLPGFANAHVIIERVSDTEVRIRKARVVPEDEHRFHEEAMPPLTDRDRDIFLTALANPPANEAFRQFVAKHGRAAKRKPRSAGRRGA